MEKDLKHIENVLMSYPNMNITNMNQKEIHIVWGVAYATPERLEELRKKIDAKRVCVSWTPAMISKGIVIFFEL